MKQICKFIERPATIVNGGYKRGRYIVWLNLNVSELSEDENQSENFQSITDRLVLSDNNISAFLEAVEDKHLAVADNDEIKTILKYFQADKDIESWKAIRKKQVEGYDQTENVNCFYLEGKPLWLDKATRVGLVNSISAEKRKGYDDTILWFDNTKIQLGADIALDLLDRIELYAKECYNVTAKHIADIDGITSVKKLQGYDITADYPPFLELYINA